MKKLQKSKNKMLFGVCGGVAESLELDPSLVRMVFIIGTFVTGSLLLWIYLLMAIVLPKSV